MSRLGTETAFEVLAKARALEAKGRDIVHLEIGEPDFDTPPSIVAAGVAALERGETHYTPSAGVVELREAIATYLEQRRGVRADPDQVIVTPGAKPIMFYALLALLDEGDEAIYPDPGFPIYSSMIDFAGARGVPLPLREENGFQPDLDELRRLTNKRTKVLILNSPNNPTGAVLSHEAIREIARVARERDLWVLTDEIYGELVYDGEHRSIALEEGMAERTILLDGFSKTFAMTGWRIRRFSPIARRSGHKARDQLSLVYGDVRSASRCSCAQIAPARGRSHDRRVQTSSRRRRERSERGLRNDVPRSTGRVLCVSERARPRTSHELRGRGSTAQ